MAVQETAGRAGRAVSRRTKALLFFAFAFAVMADAVSSVAYAIEGVLRALHGHFGLLLSTIELGAWVRNGVSGDFGRFWGYKNVSEGARRAAGGLTERRVSPSTITDPSS